MFTPEMIIIHCSATPADWLDGDPVEVKRDEITRWHVEDRGWKGNGYATIIDRDGSRAIGRDLDGDGDPYDEIGAHTKGWNSKAIGICLLGGFGSSATDAFEENFTAAQDAALRHEIAALMARFPSIKRVAGHNEFAAKACPGFHVPTWWSKKAPKGDDLLDSNTNLAAVGTAVATISTAITPLVSDNPVSQSIVTGGLVVAALGFLGYIVYSRVSKQKRGIV